jgi:hypothetical protein
MISRYTSCGQEITQQLELWSDTDYEMVVTNFPHPAVTTGQKTNGPATVWVRSCRRGASWLPTNSCSRRRARVMIAAFGIEVFEP